MALQQLCFQWCQKKEKGKKNNKERFCDFATSLWIWTRGSQRSWEKREEEQVFVVACELWVSSLFLYKFCYVLLVEKQKRVSNNKNLKWVWYFLWGGCCVCGLRLFNVEFHLKEKEKTILVFVKADIQNFRKENIERILWSLVLAFNACEFFNGSY